MTGGPGRKRLIGGRVPAPREEGGARFSNVGSWGLLFRIGPRHGRELPDLAGRKIVVICGLIGSSGRPVAQAGTVRLCWSTKHGRGGVGLHRATKKTTGAAGLYLGSSPKR